MTYVVEEGRKTLGRMVSVRVTLSGTIDMDEANPYLSELELIDEFNILSTGEIVDWEFDWPLGGREDG